MDSAVADIDFVARSTHRVGVLETLVEEPTTRDTLRQATGASSPTMGRVLSDFASRRWVEREGPRYALTPLGEFVADRFFVLCDAMDVERKLRDVWQWLPREMEGFSVDLFADAVVSYPGPAYPYQPVERVTQLIQETSAMAGFGTTVFKSLNNAAVCDAILAGMSYEYVYSPEVLAATVAWDPERVAAAAACENCTVLVHSDLPDERRCGLGIFDDRIGICCHDAETGLLEAVVDTDAPTAREWAVSVFERYRDEAEPLSAAEAQALFPAELVA